MKTNFTQPLLLTIFAVLTFGCGQTKLKGYEAGNGGDEAQLTIYNARTSAEAQLQLVKKCGIPSRASARVQEFLAGNLDQLIEDVRSSDHQWVANERSSCGWTQRTSKAPIQFSYAACRAQSPKEAEAVLIHESVHHFGYEDTDDFPTAVAAAVQSIDGSSCVPADDKIRWQGVGSNFKQTVSLSNVTFNTELCFDYHAPNWKVFSYGDPRYWSLGRYWVVAYVNNKWTGTAVGWIRGDSKCLSREQISIQFGGNTIGMWQPAPGELVGFMVSTSLESTVRERSNILWMKWPGASKQ